MFENIISKQTKYLCQLAQSNPGHSAKLLSKDGGTTTTPNDPIVHWAIAHLCQRPSFRWTKGQSCTNIQIGPLKWGCSSRLLQLQSIKLPQEGPETCLLLTIKSYTKNIACFIIFILIKLISKLFRPKGQVGGSNPPWVKKISTLKHKFQYMKSVFQQLGQSYQFQAEFSRNSAASNKTHKVDS